MISIKNLHWGYLFVSEEDRNIFHQVNTRCNIFTSGIAMRENIRTGVHKWNIIWSNKFSVYFMLY